MRFLLFLIVPIVFAACGDSAEEARELQEKAQADSLRTQIRATRARIDSLRKQGEAIRALADSLDMRETNP